MNCKALLCLHGRQYFGHMPHVLRQRINGYTAGALNSCAPYATAAQFVSRLLAEWCWWVVEAVATMSSTSSYSSSMSWSAEDSKEEGDVTTLSRASSTCQTQFQKLPNTCLDLDSCSTQQHAIAQIHLNGTGEQLVLSQTLFPLFQWAKDFLGKQWTMWLSQQHLQSSPLLDKGAWHQVFFCSRSVSTEHVSLLQWWGDHLVSSRWASNEKPSQSRKTLTSWRHRGRGCNLTHTQHV